MRRKLDLIFALALKDWQLFFADRRAALLCFAVPIILASAFGMVFHKPTSGTQAPRLPLVIVDEDHSELSRLVVADLLASDRVEAYHLERSEVDARIADRQPGIAIVLPRGLSEGLMTKNARPQVEMLFHPLCAGESHWAEGIITEAIIKRLARQRLAPLMGESATNDALAVPFQVVRREAQHDAFNSYTHSFNGMTLQYLLFWGMESGLLLLRDRQKSLWLRLRSSPVPMGILLLGKAFSTAVIALLMVTVTFGFGAIAFGVRIEGSVIGFFVLAAAASGLASTMGLLVASLGGTEARARSICILAILGISMLGGLWIPSFILPGWARDIALSLPTTWAMRGLDQVTWQTGSFWSILPSLSALIAFMALFLSIAVAKILTSEARRRRGIL